MSWWTIRCGCCCGGLSLGPALALGTIAQHDAAADQRREAAKQSFDATSFSLKVGWINKASIRHRSVTGMEVGPLCCRGHIDDDEGAPDFCGKAE